MPILNVLIPIAGVHIMFVGGMIDSSELCSNCSPADNILKHIHIDTFFCGCRGLHPTFGRSNEMLTGIDEIGTVQTFVSASDFVVALVDHTKFGKIFSLQLLQINQINLVITSEATQKTHIEQIRQAGVTVDTVSIP